MRKSEMKAERNRALVSKATDVRGNKRSKAIAKHSTQEVLRIYATDIAQKL